MLTVIKLNGIILSGIMLCGMLMLTVIKLNGIILSGIMVGGIMLSGCAPLGSMLSVIILSVYTPSTTKLRNNLLTPIALGVIMYYAEWH